MALYKVRIGRDEYIGTADEVVAFMARAEGAPSSNPEIYMRVVAGRIARDLGVDTISFESPEAFLLSIQESGVIPVEAQGEPSDERQDPRTALGDGPLAYGPGVDPDDVDIG